MAVAPSTVEPTMSVGVFAQTMRLREAEQTALIMYLQEQGLDPWGYYAHAAWTQYHQAMLHTPVTR